MTVITVYLIFCMLAVIYFDVTRYIIPNWLVGSLLLLYPVAVWMAPLPLDWTMALAAVGTVFAIGDASVAVKWMGAGDIKLLTACALWVGWGGLLNFIFTVALLGGALAAGLWLARKALPHAQFIKRETPWPRILREGEPVPYGVAIAAAMLLLLKDGGLPGLGG